MILTALLISLAINTIFFIIAYKFQTDRFTDFTYSLTFIVLAIVFFFNEQSVYAFIIAFFIMLWAFRLGVYLFIRIHKMGRDARFDTRRSSFIKFGMFWLLQAVTCWVLMLPFYFASDSHTQLISFSNNPLFLIGTGLFFAGLGIETIADFQKYRYKLKSSADSSTPWIQDGLWKYSRHPNYFGEIILWWGLFLISFNGLEQFEYVTVLSPIFITFLLVKVSGIPLLEKKYDTRFANNLLYKKYKTRTSLLVPWPPGK